MAHLHATQTIPSVFGMFHAGDVVPAADIEPVKDAWVAAGLLEEHEDHAPTPAAAPAKVEKATRRAPETATSRRQASPTKPSKPKHFKGQTGS